MKDFFKINTKQRLVALGLVLVFTLVYVHIRVKMYHQSFTVNSNLKLKDELFDKNKKLKIEVASLASPARIERLAEKLNLKMNAKSRVQIAKYHDAEGK